MDGKDFKIIGKSFFNFFRRRRQIFQSCLAKIDKGVSAVQSCLQKCNCLSLKITSVIIIVIMLATIIIIIVVMFTTIINIIIKNVIITKTIIDAWQQYLK